MTIILWIINLFLFAITVAAFFMASIIEPGTKIGEKTRDNTTMFATATGIGFLWLSSNLLGG